MANHTSEGLILGCGNPLLDISANVDECLLLKYDLKPDDAILAEEKHKPLYKELVDKYNAEYIAGGSVQNSFRVAQWLLQKPNVTTFFGCVGKDEYSNILRAQARKDGVNVRYQSTDKDATGTCGVLITGNHRSLCANLAAANHFTLDHLNEPENSKLIEKAQYFYISGFFLTVSPPTVMTIAKHALEKNKTFLMNLSAPFLSQFFNKPLMDALPYVDILFGNEAEATAFAKAQGWKEEQSMKEIGKLIVGLPKENTNKTRVVIITQGHNPVLVIQEHKINEYPVDELKASQIVDTNGAGDAFVGGFIAQFIQEKSYDICIRSAMWAARQIIQRSGCTFDGYPDFAE